MDTPVNIQWNEDRSIVTVTLTGTNRAFVDTYISSNLEMLRSWEKGKTIYLIQNVSHDDVSFTPYLRARLSEIEDVMKAEKLHVFAAIVVGNNLTGHVIQAFGKLFLTNMKDVKQRFFTSITAAQEWLEQEQQNQTE